MEGPSKNPLRNNYIDQGKFLKIVEKLKAIDNHFELRNADDISVFYTVLEEHNKKNSELILDLENWLRLRIAAFKNLEEITLVNQNLLLESNIKQLRSDISSLKRALIENHIEPPSTPLYYS